jgi:predicted RNase H-like nuclease
LGRQLPGEICRTHNGYVAITCIGLDLAWSARNLTGAATIRGNASGGTLIDSAVLHTDDDIVAYVLAHAATDTVLVAVDAPLRVPNHTGRRTAEAEIQACLGAYDAAAYPANRRMLTRYNGGQVRGEALVAALAGAGFVETAAIPAGAEGRLIVEVYPHAAMIGLFALERTLKYKQRRNRPRSDVLSAWRVYQQHMRNLSHADPPLAGHADLLAQDVAAMRGRASKRYEDQIDALLCAYVLLFAFRWGTARCRTFGSLADGHIFTPVAALHPIC